jgi:DNA-binding FrmR family transcriptional regulator
MENEARAMLQEAECPHCRTKERSPQETRDLINRLSRIEGQIRGIRGMLERDAYCPDILAQAAAANAALNAFSRELLSSHIRSCVVNDVRAGNDEIVDELKKYGTVTVDTDMCIICVVGDLDWSNVGLESEATEAMKNIPVRMISYGGSNYNISFLIKESDKKRALQSLSDTLFKE